MDYYNFSKNIIFKTIILLIIFLIIFTPFSFAQTSTDLTEVGLNGSNYNLDIDYITTDFDYYFLSWNKFSSGGSYYTQLNLFCSNSPMRLTSNTYVDCSDSSQFYVFTAYSRSNSNSSYNFNDTVYYWNNTVFIPSNNTYTYSSDNWKTIKQTITTAYSSGYYLNLTLANYDVKDNNGNTIFDNNVYSSPQFDNTSSDISSLSFNDLFISPRDYGVNNTLYLHRLAVTDMVQNGNDWIYYYSDLIFSLNNKSAYFYEMGGNSGKYYYAVPKYKFQLSANTKYVFLLTSSSSSINNTTGLIDSSYSENIYDIDYADTTNNLTDSDINVLTQQNIDDNMQNISNDVNNLNSSSPSSDLSSDIEDTFGDVSNDNSTVSNIRSGFFSRLTNIVSSLSSYDLSEDTVINIPIPVMFVPSSPDEPGVHLHYITFHSNIISSNIKQSILPIIYSFWYFIFGLYLWRFINKIYISISTGNILDSFSSSGETITNNMV